MSEFVAQILAELDLSKLQEQLEKIKKQKIELEVDIKNKDAEKALKSSIEKGLKSTKIDTSTLSQQLADSFNIKDKSVISKIKSQLNSMMSDLGNTWNGKQFDFNKSKGFFNGMDGLAKMVTENANVIQSKMGIHDEFYKYFKDKKIYVSAALKSAMGKDEYDELLRNNVGKIVRDAAKGVSIDSIWGEMTQLFPEHFADNVTNQVDQITRAFDVLRAAREDMTTVIPAQDLSQEQLFGLSESAYENIVPMTNRLAETLQRNIQSAAEGASNTFELNVDINAEKIVSDIRAAIQSATGSLDDAIQINVRLNDEEVLNQLRTSISQISSGDEPVQVDVQVNKQSLQADLEAALQNLDLPIHFNIDAAELEADLRNAVNSITDIEVDLRVNTDGIRADVDNALTGGRDIPAPDVDTSGLGDMERILGNVNGAGVQGQSVFQALGGSFREAFSTFTLANILQDSIYKVIDVGREAIGTVKELNDVTVSLQMATGKSYGAVTKMMQDYNVLGKELGSITVDVASGADSWLRQGKSIAETNTLIKDTMVLSKVSNLSAADSTDYLTASMNGYKVAVEDVMGIVDKVSAIDLASATDAGGLMEAMSRVATTADMAGVSMDKLLAMLATTGEVTQASMSSIGNAYKTIFTRMSDIKSGKLKLIDEDGTTEILSDVEQTLANVGIDLRKTVTEYNSYSAVLDNLAAKWNTLSQLQQNALSKAFAGTRQAENFRVLMENYGRVQKYTAIAQNSSGTSEQKFDFYLDSLEAKTNSLKASLEALASTTLPTNLYAGFLDGAKAVVDFTEKTDLLKASLAGLGAAGSVYAVQQLTGFLRGAVQEFSNLSQAMKILKAGNISTEGFQNLLNLTRGLSESQTRLVLTSTALTNAQRIAILTNQGLIQAEAQASVAAMGLAGAEGTATGATVTLSGALHGLWATLLANPLVLVAAGVTASVMAFSAYQRSIEDAVKSVQKAGNEFGEAQTSLDDYMSRVQELRTQLESGTLSEQEAYTVKSELLSIQQALTESYGEAAGGLDLMNGSLETQIGLMKQLSKEDANRFLNKQGEEGRTGVKKVKEKMEEENDYRLGFNIPDFGSEFSEKIKSIAKSMEDAGISLTDNMDGTFNIEFTGDATDAEKVIGDFQNQIRGLGKMAERDGMTPIFEDISSYTSDAYKEANGILDEFQETYTQIKQAEMILDESVLKTSYDEKDNTKSYTELFADYGNAINNYNDALMSGDISKIQEAKKTFDAIQSDVDKFASDSAYSGLFDELGSTLDEASIKYQDFTSLLSDTDASKSAEKLSDDYTKSFKDLPKKYAEALKEMDMTDVDFKDALFTKGIQRGETAVNALVQAAQDMGLITGSSADEVQPLIDVLGNLGYISVGTAGDLDALADSAENVETSFSDLAMDNSSKLLDQIDSVKSALTSQATGMSVNYGDFTSDELLDYQDALEFVNGTMQLNTEKVRELAEAKVKEQVATNEAAKAMKQQEYLENARQIENLRQKIQENNLATDENSESIQMQIDGLLSSNDAIANQIGQLNLLNTSLMESVGLYQQWKDAQGGPEAGDMFDDTLTAMQVIDDTLNNTKSDNYGRVGREDYKASLGLIIPDSVDASDQQAVNNYMDSISSLFTYKDGEREGLNIEEFCKQAVDKGLMVLDEAGENYQVAGGKTMEDFAKGLNLAMPFVQAMFGEMQEFGAKFDWSDEAVQSMGDLGVAANEAAESLRGIEGNENLKIKLDVSDLESSADKISALDGTIQEMNGVKAKVGVSTEEVEQANTIIQYCVAQKQQLEAPAVMKVDTSMVQGKIGEAIALLQQFQTAQNNLQMQEALGLDTSEAQAEVDAVAQKIQALDTNVTTTLGIDATSIETISATIQALTPEMMVKAGVDDSAIIGFQNAEHNSEGTVFWDNDTGAVDSYAGTLKHSSGEVAWYNDTSAVKTQFEATGYVNWQNTTPPSGGPHSVNGTAHAAGTALAGGNWGTASGGMTLVGELGREIVVDPYTGRWRTVGDNGAEFTDIPKGAIVFNHIQTENLLKNGYVSSRAAALVSGTALASGNAMVTGGISVSQSQKPLQHATGSKPSGPSDSTIRDNTSAINKGTTATEEGAKAVEDATDEISEDLKKTIESLDKYMDFISIAIEKASKRVDKFAAAVDRWETGKHADINLRRQLKADKDKVKLLDEARLGYLKHANFVASEVGLSDELKKKVQTGEINIKLLSADDKAKVEKYKEWWDLAVDVRDQIRETKYEMLDIAQQRVENVLSTYDIGLGKREAKDEYYNTMQTYMIKRGYSQKPGSRYDKMMQKELYYKQEEVRLSEQRATDYKKQMANYLKENGGVTSDPVYQAMKKQLIELNTSTLEAKIAVEELKDAIQDNTEQVMQWAIDRWTRAGEKQDAAIEYKKVADGRILKERDYMERMKSYNLEVETTQRLRDEKYRDYIANLKSVSNEEAQAKLNEIAELDKQIIQLGTNMENLKNEIMALRWEPFEKAQEELDGVISEFDTIQGLMQEESFFNKDGSYTENGMTNIMLLQKQMEASKQKTANYREALDDLEEQYKNGCWSAEEYRQKEMELQQGLRDSITATEEYRREMLDMYETRIKMENDLLQKNIDKRLEALDAKEKYYDYDKTIKKKSRDVNALRASIQALTGTTNSASRARLEKLKAELADAEDDMEDTVHKHEAELKKNGFEDLSSDAEKALENTLDAVRKNSDFQQAIIDDMLNQVTDNYTNTYDNLNGIIENHGLVASDVFDQMISKIAEWNREAANMVQPNFGNMNNNGVYMGSSNAQNNINNAVDRNDTAQEAGDMGQNDKDEYEDERKALAKKWYDSLGTSQWYGKIPEGASPMARWFMERNKGVNGRVLKKFATLMGLDVTGKSDHVSEWDKGFYDTVFNLAKKYCYADGGYVDYDRYIPLEQFDAAGKAHGEWGAILAKRREFVMNEDLTASLVKAVPQIDYISNVLSAQNDKSPSLNASTGDIIIQGPLINIEGNVDRDVMDDLESMLKNGLAGERIAELIYHKIDKYHGRDIPRITGKKKYFG